MNKVCHRTSYHVVEKVETVLTVEAKKKENHCGMG